MAKSKSKAGDRGNIKSDRGQENDSAGVKNSNSKNEKPHTKTEDVVGSEQSIDSEDSPLNTRPTGMDA